MNAIILAPGQETPAELGERIRMRVRMAENHLKKALEYALEIGGLLNEAKPQIKHGEWQDWLTAHCDLAPRTASAYMRLAKAYPALSQAERQRVADLPVREAVKAISTDPAAPPADKTAPARRLNSADDRARVKGVFAKARNKLTATMRVIDYGMPIKGSDVAALRKQLESVLEQLTELQKTDVQLDILDRSAA